MRRFIRFEHQGKRCWGLWEDEWVRPLEGTPPHEARELDTRLKAREVRLLAPCDPSKVVAVGLNYRDHAEETGHPIPEEPLLFMKPSTSVIGPGEPIRLPPSSKRVDYEAELGVVIGKRAFRVPEERALDHVWGYTCLNDVTARDLQSKDGQWTRSKSFDTFCPIGPWIVEGLDPSDLSVEGWLNGEPRQRSRTRNLIFPVPRLICFVSHIMTLLPGDVIATGTPSGIGPVKSGDIFEVRIQGIGVLENPVA
jgi:2-keto-4-pentenoate hydratase/2-oxohepta-3-ene-1,7-dioic acid hydratase in catechol pathway